MWQLEKAKLSTITIHIPSQIKEIEANNNETAANKFKKKNQQTVSNSLFAITMY